KPVPSFIPQYQIARIDGTSDGSHLARGSLPSPCHRRGRATMKIAAGAFMRILIVSDIHANWPALSAVRESCDVCLFLGDLVDYGTDPVPCIDWVRRNAHYSIRGNHDHGAAHGVTVTGGVGVSYLYAGTPLRAPPG